MRRNKRCLLAYHRTRCDKLEEMVWEGVDLGELAQEGQEGRGEEGGRGGGEGNGEGNTSSISPEEEEYVRLYGDLLAAYKGRWTDVDLTGSLEPPRDLFIDVRVLKDAGEIQTEYGLVFSLPFLVYAVQSEMLGHMLGSLLEAIGLAGGRGGVFRGMGLRVWRVGMFVWTWRRDTNCI